LNSLRLFKALFFLAILLFGSWFAYTYRDIPLQDLRKLILSFGVWTPIVFVLIYSVSVVLLLPGALMTLTGGLIFGPVLGTALNMAGAMFGASTAFLLARFSLRDWVIEKSAGKLEQIMDGVADEGWKFVAFLRLVPVIPFTLLNYTLGVTKVSFSGYFFASIIFMLPGCIAYTYLGSLGEAVIESDAKSNLGKIFLAIGLLAIVAVIPVVIKRYKNANKGK